MKNKRKQLAMQLMRLDEVFLRYIMISHANKDINPHKGQGRVLTILKMQPEMEQKELGYLLDISKQALAELLNKLEKRGYITREKSEKDRRSFVIKLTDAGCEAISEEKDEIDDDYIEEIFDSLSDKEQEDLINYMGRIIDTIEKKIGFDKDDYASFFRERFFARHGHRHNLFKGFMGFNHPRFQGFRGFDNEK